MLEKMARRELAAVVNAFHNATGWKLSTISLRATKDARLLQRFLLDGGSMTFTKYDLALIWFSKNWPEGAGWPGQVKRPGRSTKTQKVRKAGKAEARGAGPQPPLASG